MTGLEPTTKCEKCNLQDIFGKWTLSKQIKLLESAVTAQYYVKVSSSRDVKTLRLLIIQYQFEEGRLQAPAHTFVKGVSFPNS